MCCVLEGKFGAVHGVVAILEPTALIDGGVGTDEACEAGVMTDGGMHG